MEETAETLKGQAAVVTGSSTGIGRAIAIELASAGANVLVHARVSNQEAEDVALHVRSLGRYTGVVMADLSDAAEQDRLVEAAWAWRPIDIWVNNAGVDVLTGPAAKWSFEEKLDALWKVDVVASLRLSREAGRRMRERGTGVIINMGWDQVETGMAGDSGEMFTAIKGAVMSATRSLAKSLAPHVRVNCIAPGWIRTDWGEQASPEWQGRATHDALVARWGSPEEVARVVYFLASPAASFVNGQILPINGGRND
jgi:3-oxoacyl-[acyl-carrier protein] reductase